MQHDSASLEIQKQNATVLANAGELISGIVKEISGNDISNSINGAKATSEMIQIIAFQRMSKRLGTTA